MCFGKPLQINSIIGLSTSVLAVSRGNLADWSMDLGTRELGVWKLESLVKKNEAWTL